ncbi:MAG TPA: hypothetical protein VL400_14735, partial [Polyangiaceae bacterium]|nr:hypothetical protein [Polyangiaceae bacterium]
LVVVDGVPRKYDDVVAESLLWDDAGTSWGGIVADRDERRLWIVVDGTPTTPIEMESLVDMVRAHARGAPSPTPAFVHALRTWVREAIASRSVARTTPAPTPSLRDSR